MRILFIAGTLGQGGAENQLYLLCKSLLDSGNEIYVFSLTNGEFWEHHLRKVGVVLLNCPSGRTNRIARLLTILNHARKIRPDVIYSMHFYTSLYAGICGRLIGAKTIGSIRSNGVEEKSDSSIFAYLNFNIPHAIVANSVHGGKEAMKILAARKVKLAILNNAIDLNKFEFKPLRNSNNPMTLLFVGSLVKTKRPWLFIEIIKKLRATGIAVNAVMIGEGALKNQVLAQINREGLDDVISLVGNIPDVTSMMFNANALISCSQREGTPNVVMEAMATGTPVFASDYAGINQLLGNNNERGYIFKDVNHAVDLLEKFFRSGCNYQSKSNVARDFIEQHHSLNNLTERFELVVKTVFGEVYN